MFDERKNDGAVVHDVQLHVNTVASHLPCDLLNLTLKLFSLHVTFKQQMGNHISTNDTPIQIMNKHLSNNTHPNKHILSMNGVASTIICRIFLFY